MLVEVEGVCAFDGAKEVNEDGAENMDDEEEDEGEGEDEDEDELGKDVTVDGVDP